MAVVVNLYGSELEYMHSLDLCVLLTCPFAGSHEYAWRHDNTMHTWQRNKSSQHCPREDFSGGGRLLGEEKTYC